jgi:hypothetical protein
MSVDVLDLRVERDSDSVWGDEVVFLVNGLDLRELVRKPNQDWIGPPTQLLEKHPDHLRGGPDRWEDPVDPFLDHAAVLACGCGQPGCDAVTVQILMGASAVEWKLLDRAGNPLNLQFNFDRVAYEASLSSVI